LAEAGRLAGPAAGAGWRCRRCPRRGSAGTARSASARLGRAVPTSPRAPALGRGLRGRRPPTLGRLRAHAHHRSRTLLPAARATPPAARVSLGCLAAPRGAVPHTNHAPSCLPSRRRLVHRSAGPALSTTSVPGLFPRGLRGAALGSAQGPGPQHLRHAWSARCWVLSHAGSRYVVPVGTTTCPAAESDDCCQPDDVSGCINSVSYSTCRCTMTGSQGATGSSARRATHTGTVVRLHALRSGPNLRRAHNRSGYRASNSRMVRRT